MNEMNDVTGSARAAAEESHPVNKKPCDQCFSPFEYKGYHDRFCPKCIVERGQELKRLKQMQQQTLDGNQALIDLDNLRRQVLENQLEAHAGYMKELEQVQAHRERMEKLALLHVKATYIAGFLDLVGPTQAKTAAQEWLADQGEK